MPSLPPTGMFLFPNITTAQRLLKEVSIVLSGKEHHPPGSIAPWLVQGGQAAIDAPWGAPAVVVGVGGAGVPTAKKSMDQGAVGRELLSHGGTGLFKVRDVMICGSFRSEMFGSKLLELLYFFFRDILDVESLDVRLLQYIFREC